jgi:polynucleotide 5'-hydroxyl-kinase GRC3/NOL9
MTNRLLSSQIDQVAILDADVGQPECSPPGVLRLSLQSKPLLQPPYWNLCAPVETVASVYYGAVTSKVDPTRYMESVQYLMQQYQEYVSNSPTPIPLIINMDGWIRGIGYQILTALIANLQPSHVCQLLGETRSQVFELSDVIPKEGTTLFFLDSCTKHGVIPRHIPSSTLRTLRLATYFGPHLAELWDSLDFLPAKQMQTGWIDKHCTLAQYLAQERPYCVPFEAVQYSFIGSDRQDLVHENQILQALNGSIVALCTSTNNCLGLGLVRSIDWNRRLFYILTPVLDLTEATKLVGGNLPLPLSLMFRGVYAESSPYLAMPRVMDGTTKALGSDPMKSRNNIGRRSLVAPAAGVSKA